MFVLDNAWFENIIYEIFNLLKLFLLEDNQIHSQYDRKTFERLSLNKSIKEIMNFREIQKKCMSKYNIWNLQ